MTDSDKNKGFNPKFEEYKLFIQRWHFLENMFWTRFNAFVAILVIGTSILTVIITVIFTIENISNSVWLFVATLFFILSLIGLIWSSMLNRLNHWEVINIDKAKSLQNDLGVHFIIKRPDNFPLITKLPAMLLINLLICAEIIGFFIAGLISLAFFFQVF